VKATRIIRFTTLSQPISPLPYPKTRGSTRTEMLIGRKKKARNREPRCGTRVRLCTRNKVCGKKNVCTAFNDKKKKYPIERKDREIASAPTAPRNKTNAKTESPNSFSILPRNIASKHAARSRLQRNFAIPNTPVPFPKTNTEQPPNKRNRRPTRKPQTTARRTLFQTFPHIPSVFPLITSTFPPPSLT